MGIDLGEIFVFMFVLGWLAIVTLPFGAVALVVWLIVACVVTLIRWRRRQREVKRPSPLLKQERT